LCGRVKMPAQPLQRQHGLVAQHRAARRKAIALDDFGAERFLALEVIVERTLGHARGRGDFLHADGVEALFSKALHPSFDDQLSDIGSGHGVSNMTSRLKCQVSNYLIEITRYYRPSISSGSPRLAVTETCARFA